MVLGCLLAGFAIKNQLSNSWRNWITCSQRNTQRRQASQASKSRKWKRRRQNQNDFLIVTAAHASCIRSVIFVSFDSQFASFPIFRFGPRLFMWFFSDQYMITWLESLEWRTSWGRERGLAVPLCKKHSSIIIAGAGSIAYRALFSRENQQHFEIKDDE